jgi:hypothetical protein
VATISSIMTLRSRDGACEAVIRIATIDPGPAIAALRANGYTVREANTIEEDDAHEARHDPRAA